MRILYLHQYFNTFESNGSTRSLEIALGMISAGHEVEIITGTKVGQKDFPRIYRGIKITWISTPYSNNLSFQKRIFIFLKYLFISSYYVLIKSYDLIYATSTPLTIGIPPLISKFIRKKEFFFEVRDVWPEIPHSMGLLRGKLIYKSLRFLASTCYDNSYLIIALSPDMKSEILINYPRVNDSKIIIAENGSKESYFNSSISIREKFQVNKDSKIVIYPGAFGIVNDVSYVVKLAKHFKNEITFILIGDGILKKSVIEEAKLNFTLNRNLFILDSLPKKDIFEIIGSSDMLISTVADIPKLEQNSANKFFDGLRAGKAILINHGGWQEEFLKKNNCGIRLSRNLHQASKQIKSIIENESLLNTMKLNARNCSEKFEIININKIIIQEVKRYEERISNM